MRFRAPARVSALFAACGIEPVSIRLFPVTVTHIGVQPPTFWRVRKAAVQAAIEQRRAHLGKAGRIVIRPPADDAGNAVLAGNTCLYGATGGDVYIAGRTGERFAVRNSGASIVTEGLATWSGDGADRKSLIVCGRAHLLELRLGFTTGVFDDAVEMLGVIVGVEDGAAAGFVGVVIQIGIVDIVFSLDSVITAVGMVDELWVMMTAVVVAMAVMIANGIVFVLIWIAPVGRAPTFLPLWVPLFCT